MDPSAALLLAGLAIGLLVGAGAATAYWSRVMAAVRSRAEGNQSMDDLLRPVRESLDSLRAASEQSRRERTAAEASLATQLAAVQDRYRSLEEATTQIAAALSKGQTRGQWGEMQLEGLLEHAGLVEGVHFVRQQARPGDEGSVRPDLVVRMAGGGEVLVDAKFPFDAYWQALGTDDATARAGLLRKHAADMMLRVKELAGRRYSDAPNSPDFVVMFLPLESLLSSSLEADGLLLEKAFDRRVVLASPTTMLALLRTVAFGYQRQLMADNAEEIREAGAEMLTRLGILVEHLDSLRKGLDQAVRGYNSFVGSFDRHAMRQARRLNELGVASNRSLETPDEIDAALRSAESPTWREAG